MPLDEMDDTAGNARERRQGEIIEIVDAAAAGGTRMTPAQADQCGPLVDSAHRLRQALGDSTTKDRKNIANAITDQLKRVIGD